MDTVLTTLSGNWAAVQVLGISILIFVVGRYVLHLVDDDPNEGGEFDDVDCQIEYEDMVSRQLQHKRGLGPDEAADLIQEHGVDECSNFAEDGSWE